MSISQILEEEIKKSVPTEECAILLSGGVDSLSVAFAAANLGKKITAYSFCLKDISSYDYKFAEGIADHLLGISKAFKLICRISMISFFNLSI